jgi:hypothetical protein
VYRLERLAIQRLYPQSLNRHRLAAGKAFACSGPGRSDTVSRGGPAVPEEVRALIRTMSREIPLWGAPRIHGELLKPGIDLGETSVSKYLVRRHQPPAQTWRTFLDNHVKTMVPILPN